MRLIIPWYHWLIDWLLLVVWVGAACFWGGYVYHGRPVIVVIVVSSILLAFVIGGVRNLVDHLKLRSLVLRENGLQMTASSGMTLLKWEDVARFDEPSKGYFALTFRSGQKIRIHVHVRNYQEIKKYVLQRLEQVGTFEDGRKTPRVLRSISFRRKA
jgi:hypothetical protein